MAFKIGRDYGIDAYEIMSWPLNKIYDYWAFYITETDEFRQNKEKEKIPSFNEIISQMQAEGFEIK